MKTVKLAKYSIIDTDASIVMDEDGNPYIGIFGKKLIPITTEAADKIIEEIGCNWREYQFDEFCEVMGN